MSENKQYIGPIDNRKKIIKEEDIEHFQLKYFEHHGEDYLKLYKEISNTSNFYPSDSPCDILNNILDFFISELKKSNISNSHTVTTLAHISKLKKEFFKLLEIYSDNGIDKIKLLAIIQAYTSKL